MEIIFGLILASLIGLAIGQARGRPLAGWILGLLLGPIGWLLVLVGPNPKKEKEKKEQEAWQLRQYQMQKQQLETMQNMRSSSSSSVPPPPGGKTLLRIARGGEDLGDMDIPKIKLMIRNGDLSIEDYYFDTECNDWMTLECHPEFAA